MSSFRHAAFDGQIEQLALSTETGFLILRPDDGLIVHESRLPEKGFDQIAVLSDSNIVALSGDGKESGLPKSTVILWDMNEHSVIRRFQHESDVLKIVFCSDLLIVVQVNHVTFYSTSDFRPYFTCPNVSHRHEVVSCVQSIGASLVSLPHPKGDSLLICDYRDPEYVLGVIPIAIDDVNYVAFDRHGELVAIASDYGRLINVWSILNLRMIASYKRGFRKAEIDGICFDSLSNYFLLTSKRGTLHVFSVPSPSEVSHSTVTSYRSFAHVHVQKGSNIYCQFEIAGYAIVSISSDLKLKKLQVDIENECVTTLFEKTVEIN